MARRFISVCILPATVLLSVVSCATSKKPSYRLQFDQDVSLLLESGEQKEVSRGEKVDLPAAPITATRSNHQSVVLLPVPSNNATLKVRLPRESGNLDGESRSKGDPKDFGREANRVAMAVVEIQSLLVEGRSSEALTKIQIVWDRYPGFSYLRFLEASCFVVKGDIERARSLVEAALEEFPDDLTGREFLAQLNAQRDRRSARQAPQEDR